MADIPGIEIDVSAVETNIVIFGLAGMNPVDFFFKAHQAGVYVLPSGPDTVRAVVSLEVNRGDVLGAVEVFRKVMAG